MEKKKVIRFATIRNIMAQKGFKSIVGQLMDEDIENYYTNLVLKINNSLVSFVFNMDKAGDDYIDTHPYHIFVPKEYEEKKNKNKNACKKK